SRADSTAVTLAPLASSRTRSTSRISRSSSTTRSCSPASKACSSDIGGASLGSSCRASGGPGPRAGRRAPHPAPPPPPPLSPPALALRHHAAPVGCHQVLDDGQSQAEAAVGPRAPRLRLAEPLEHLGQEVGPDPHARVGHRQGGVGGIALHLHLDAAALGGEL